jgi:hypothetical protein
VFYIPRPCQPYPFDVTTTKHRFALQEELSLTDLPTPCFGVLCFPE